MILFAPSRLPAPRQAARRVAVAAALLFAATGAGDAEAQVTWNAAANTTWDTSSANWNPGPAAWTVNSNAVFDTTASVANRAITVSGTQSVGTLTVSSTNYSFTGGALQYTQGISGAWTFNQGATINSGLTATLSGTNQAFLTTTNNSAAGALTITGPVTMQGSGTTWFQTDGRFTFLGSTVTLTDVGMSLWFNNGATYRFENSTVSITSNQTTGFSRGINMPAGTINVVSSTITTPAMLVGNGGGGTLNMTSGLITTGTLQFNPYNGTSTGNLNLDGGTIELMELQRAGDAGGANTTSTLSFNGGTLRARANNAAFINAAAGATTTARVMAGGARFDTNGFDITVPVSLTSGTTNDGGLVKSSAGTLMLSASNGYLGTTAINGGVLLVSHSGALAGGGNVTFGGGSLQYSASNTADYSARIANSGSAISINTGGQSVTFAGGIGSSNTGGLAKLGLGTLSLSGSNGYTGATTISAGVLAVGANALAGGGNVTFSGGTLQYLAGNTADYAARIKNSGSTAAIDTAGQSVTYGDVIDASNTAGLTKSGSGTLTLAGVNTYSGTTTVNAGTLAVGPGAQLGATGIVKAAAGTLDLAGNNLTIRGLFNDAGQTTALVTNSGTGTVILTSTTPAGIVQSLTFYGTMADGPGGGKLGLSVGQSNGWGGSGNTFVLGTGGTATYSGPTIIGTGLGATTVAGLVNPNSAYTVNGGAFLDVSGVSGTIGSLGGGYGAISNFRAGVPATLSIGSLNTDSQYQGRIEDGLATLSITKVGTGRLTFLDFGTNTYTGVTTVSQGVLNIQKATALGTTAAGTVVASGAALEIQGGITVGAEALTLAGVGVGGTGALRNVSGTNSYGGAITLGSATRINADLGRLTLSGAVGGAGQNLMIGGAGSVTISGDIATAGGSLTKDGAGTLVLSGSNTYSGGTGVNAGTLAVNGSLGSGLVSVASAATLMGSGTIGGAVSILGGGIVAPGNSPGTLSVNDAFTLADTSVLSFEFNAQNTTVGGGVNDLITGVTNLTLDGVLNISGSGDWTSIANNTTWRLFNYTGTLTDNVLSIGTQPTLGAGQTLQISTATAGQVNLVIVPEPGGILLAAVGMAGAAWLVRRRA